MEQLSTNDIPYDVTSEHSHVNLDENTQNLLSQFQINPHLSNKDLLSAEIPDPEDEELNLLKRALLLDEETSPTIGSSVTPSIPFVNSFTNFNTALPGNDGSNPTIIQSNFPTENFPKQLENDFTLNNNLTLDTANHNLHYNNSLNNLQMSLASIPHKLPVLSHSLQNPNNLSTANPHLNSNSLPASIPFSSNLRHPGYNNYYINGNGIQNVTNNVDHFPMAHTLSYQANPHFNPPSLPRTQFSTNGHVQSHVNIGNHHNVNSVNNHVLQPSRIASTPKKKKADAPKISNDLENADPNEVFLGKNGNRYQIGDFILLNSNPSNDDKICVAQLLKVASREPQTFSGMLYKFANQIGPNSDKSFQPSEIIRTLTAVKFGLDDIIDRCFVLPESEFNELDEQFINSYKVFLLRYRYHEKKNELVKARNLNVLLRDNIKEFKSLFPSKKDPSFSKRVRFSVSKEGSAKPENRNGQSSGFKNPNDILINSTQSKVGKPLHSAPDFSMAASKCSGFKSKENSTLLPCNNRNNVKWFTTPPLHPPPASLEVAHSLDYLVHLARKRKVAVSNLTV